MHTNSELEKLTVIYRDSFPKKKNQLNEAFQLILEEDWSKESLSVLKHLAHKLSGSTGLYGFTELSTVIQALEKAIDRFKQTEPEKERIKKLFYKAIEVLNGAIYSNHQNTDNK